MVGQLPAAGPVPAAAARIRGGRGSSLGRGPGRGGRRRGDHGLAGPTQATIIEIGAVRLSGGQVTGEFFSLVSPGPGSRARHHRADRDHRRDGQPAPRRRPTPCAAFLAFASGAVLVAHNAPFDLGFLTSGCRGQRAGLAGHRGAGHRGAGPAGAARGPGARLQAGHPGRVLRAPGPRPATGPWPTPRPPARCCWACWTWWRPPAGSGPRRSPRPVAALPAPRPMAAICAEPGGQRPWRPPERPRGRGGCTLLARPGRRFPAS